MRLIDMRACIRAAAVAVLATVALTTTATAATSGALEPGTADLAFLKQGSREAFSLDAASSEAAGLVAPVIDAEYIALLGNEAVTEAQSEARAACPAEAMKRIALCQKVVRTFLSPDPNPLHVQVVPFTTTWSSSSICATLVKAFPHTVESDSCQNLASHVFGAAGSTVDKLVQMSRQSDIHDMCVKLLVAPFPAGTTQSLIASTDAAACSLQATGGITGLRVLMFHGMAIDRLQYHGAAAPGYLYAYDGWLGKWPKYWSVQDQLDGLADVRYYVTDTNVRGWNVPALQAEYCAAIAKFNPHVIFTHSMGNNIIAAAIGGNVGDCKRITKQAGAGSVLWFSSQAPWLGSPAAAAAATACAGGAVGALQKLKQKVVAASASCAKQLATPTLAPTFKNTAAAFQLADMKRVAAEHVSGALCGLSAAPLTVGEAFSVNGVGLWTLSSLGQATTLVNWGADAKTQLTAPYSGNDGLVAFSDCNIGGTVSYGTTPASPFYVGQFSHEDGPCFVADKTGAVPSMKLPCTWYVNRVISACSEFHTPNQVSNSYLVSPKVYMPFAATYPHSFLQQAAHAEMDAQDQSESVEADIDVEADAEASEE